MKKFAIITGLLSGFLFGIATPFSKMLLNGLNSFQLAGLLYLGAALAMIPFVLKQRGQIQMLFKYWEMTSGRQSRTTTQNIHFKFFHTFTETKGATGKRQPLQ